MPHPGGSAYGLVLTGCGAGPLIVALAYARLLRRGAAPRTVLLVGRPWEGRMLLARTVPC